MNLVKGKKDSHQLFELGFSKSKGVVQLNSEERARLQDVLLTMLQDFIRVAEKYSLTYTLSGGSVLGAVRHHGFIPWDDDLDINIPRKDFNRFTQVFKKELGDKYILCLPQSTNGHGMAVAQLKKRGTLFRSFNELSKDEEQCGICIDIFVIENTYNNFVIRNIHGVICLAFGYLCSCIKTHYDLPLLLSYLDESSDAEKNFKKKAFIGRLFSWIPLDWITRVTVKIYSFCKNDKSRYVTIPTGRKHFFRELQLRSTLCNTKDAEFEGIKVKIPAGYVKYLRSLYGDNFMQIPPKEKRETHPIMEIDFCYNNEKEN